MEAPLSGERPGVAARHTWNASLPCSNSSGPGLGIFAIAQIVPHSTAAKGNLFQKGAPITQPFRREPDPPQIASGTIAIAPQGHSWAHTPQPLQ